MQWDEYPPKSVCAFQRVTFFPLEALWGLQNLQQGKSFLLCSIQPSPRRQEMKDSQKKF